MREVCEKRERECAKNLKKKESTEKKVTGNGKKRRKGQEESSGRQRQHAHVQRQGGCEMACKGKCDEPKEEERGRGCEKKNGSSGRKKKL